MNFEHNVIDSDVSFTIDPISRQIENVSGKNVIVQTDHDSERFTFELPRYIEGHDMSKCNSVEIYYLNTNSSTKAKHYGVFVSADMKVHIEKEDTVVFSWLISSDATIHVGDLKFSVCLSCKDGECVEYAWNTAIYSGVSVLEGMPKDLNIDSNAASILNTIRMLIDESGVCEYDGNFKSDYYD